MANNASSTQGIPGATTSVEKWNVDGAHVERLLDNAPLISAHPEDTLVFAGPARRHGDNFLEKLLPIGMLQNFNTGQNKPLQPMGGIGSRRNFFLSGRSQNNFSMSRLFMNGRNLLRVLATQAVQAGVDLSRLNVRPIDEQTLAVPDDGPEWKFLCNLDSELFAVPFGLGILFKDKREKLIGGLYLELANFNNWGLGFSMGQNMIAEQVSGLFDRVVPFTIPMEGNPEISKLGDDVLGLEARAQELGMSPEGDTK